MSLLLAAIRSASPAPVPAGLPGSAPTPLPIRDIAPPVEISPLLPWQMALLVAGGVVVLALLAAGLWWWARHRPAAAETPLLTPRQAALAELERLRPQVPLLSPYDFSIAVSGVLRTFLERQHGLRALEQTSPEFLAALAEGGQFTAADRALLQDFLERCDLIKFARAAADQSSSEALLGSATGFVQGGQA